MDTDKHPYRRLGSQGKEKRRGISIHLQGLLSPKHRVFTDPEAPWTPSFWVFSKGFTT